MPRDMVQVQGGSRRHFKGPEARINRSQFNRSHGLKMTFDASYLVPILVDEVLPGDTFTCSLHGFARVFSPLLAPVMDNIEMQTFFFFCPARLLWTNWAAFMGEHDGAGAQDTTYTIPVMGTGLVVDHDAGTDEDRLAAYMGLPHGLASASVTGVSSLPFRAYNLIYNNWFKDQNLRADITLTTGDGPDTVGNYNMQKGGKKHDYFTSALPYLQKGTAQGMEATVFTDVATGGDIAIWSTDAASYQHLEASAVETPIDVDNTAGLSTEKLYAEVDINALREAVLIQRMLERDARGGTRYVERIKAHFGVTNPDFRLQRPEYLGGGKSYINITPVANTSPVDSTNAPGGADINAGQLAGVGTGIVNGHGWAKSFTEHGYIIGLVRARGDLTYFQGLDKMWSRSAAIDFYIPALANLGEQSILNKEIWVSNSAGTDDAVWGYQERWAEYRTKMSRVVGNFNPDVTASLSYWHLAEDFAALPALNSGFMEDSTPMSRVQAVTTEDDFLLDIWFNYKCARPMPVFGLPSLVGRF